MIYIIPEKSAPAEAGRRYPGAKMIFYEFIKFGRKIK
jgi:hypothetical protein